MIAAKHAPVTLDKDTGVLTATETICITKDGRIVPEDDPEANMVLVAAGQPIPKGTAQKYGIKASKEKEQAPAEEQPEEQAPAGRSTLTEEGLTKVEHHAAPSAAPPAHHVRRGK